MPTNTDLEFLQLLKIQELRIGEKMFQYYNTEEIDTFNISKKVYNVNYYRNIANTEISIIATPIYNIQKLSRFMLTITRKGKSSLLLFNKHIGYYENEHNISSNIVLYALKIAIQKGAKTFEFIDNSMITIDEQKIPLVNLLFLTIGKSYYEQFLPIIIDDEKSNAIIEFRRKKCNTNTWRTVYNNLIKKEIDTSFNITDIDIDEAGSAMKVLERAKNSKQYTNFFYKHMDELICASDISALHGMSWILNTDTVSFEILDTKFL